MHFHFLFNRFLITLCKSQKSHQLYHTSPEMPNCLVQRMLKMLCKFGSKGFPSIIQKELKVKDYLSLKYVTHFCLQKLNIYLLHVHKGYLVSVQQIFNYRTSMFQQHRLSVCLYQDQSTSSKHKYIISFVFSKFVLELIHRESLNPWSGLFIFYFLPALHLSILLALVTGLSNIQMCHSLRTAES